MVPWVQQGNAGLSEVRQVTGDDGHTMHKRGCGDQRIPVRARVGHMQPGATQRCRRVDRQGALREFGQDMVIHPGAQLGSLRGVAPLDAQDAKLKLHERDDRDIKGGSVHTGQPNDNTCVGLAIAGFAQLGDDVGVKQEH